MGNRIGLLFSGFGLGIAVAMLYAPTSGRQTRTKISGKIVEGEEYLKQQATEVRRQVNDRLQQGAELVNKSKSAVRAAVDAGKHEYLRQTVVANRA